MQILHTGWRSFPFNFRQLVYGKSLLNIADSFYAVALSVGLVSVYHISVRRTDRCNKSEEKLAYRMSKHVCPSCHRDDYMHVYARSHSDTVYC